MHFTREKSLPIVAVSAREGGSNRRQVATVLFPLCQLNFPGQLNLEMLRAQGTSGCSICADIRETRPFLKF